MQADDTPEGSSNPLNSSKPVIENSQSFIRATNEHPALPDDAEVFDGLNSYMAHMQVYIITTIYYGTIIGDYIEFIHPQLHNNQIYYRTYTENRLALSVLFVVKNSSPEETILEPMFQRTTIKNYRVR